MLHTFFWNSSMKLFLKFSINSFRDLSWTFLIFFLKAPCGSFFSQYFFGISSKLSSVKKIVRESLTMWRYYYQELADLYVRRIPGDLYYLEELCFRQSVSEKQKLSKRMRCEINSPFLSLRIQLFLPDNHAIYAG